MDNLALQVEELEVLNAIYEDQWKIEMAARSYSIQITPDIKLWISLNDDYPTSSPPNFELLAPVLSADDKNLIAKEFQEIYSNSCGSPVLFQWIEKLKEIVEISNLKREQPALDGVLLDSLEAPSENQRTPQAQFRAEVTHGSVIQDRKSSFQGHICVVQSQQETRLFMDHLIENKKIAQATHNISAYRISLPTGIILQDCDDDGETHAGGRLLHLLQILDLKNVMVVVSRWYGGIHLGPDRFKHINNAAREALIQAGFINQR